MHSTEKSSHRRRRSPPDAHVLPPLPSPCATVGYVSSFPRAFSTGRISAEANETAPRTCAMEAVGVEGDDEEEIVASASTVRHTRAGADVFSCSPWHPGGRSAFRSRSRRKEKPCLFADHERGNSTPNERKREAESRSAGERRGPTCVVRSPLASHTFKEPHFLPRQEAGLRVSPAAHRMGHASHDTLPSPQPPACSPSVIATRPPSASDSLLFSRVASGEESTRSIGYYHCHTKDAHRYTDPTPSTFRGGGVCRDGALDTMPDRLRRLPTGPSPPSPDAPATVHPIPHERSPTVSPKTAIAPSPTVEEASARLAKLVFSVSSSPSASPYVDPVPSSPSSFITTMGKIVRSATAAPAKEEGEEWEGSSTTDRPRAVERGEGARWSAVEEKDEGKREKETSRPAGERTQAIPFLIPFATVAGSPWCVPVAVMASRGLCGGGGNATAIAGPTPVLRAVYPFPFPSGISLCGASCQVAGGEERRGIGMDDHGRWCTCSPPPPPPLGGSGDSGGSGNDRRQRSAASDGSSPWRPDGRMTAVPIASEPHAGTSFATWPMRAFDSTAHERSCACGGGGPSEPWDKSVVGTVNGKYRLGVTHVASSSVPHEGETPPPRSCSGTARAKKECHTNDERERTNDTEKEKNVGSRERSVPGLPRGGETPPPLCLVGGTSDSSSSCEKAIQTVAGVSSAVPDAEKVWSASPTEEVAIPCGLERFPSPVTLSHPSPSLPPSGLSTTSPSPIPPSLATPMSSFPYSCASLITRIYGVTNRARNDGGSTTTTIAPALDAHDSFAAWKDRLVLEREKDGGFLSCAYARSSKGEEEALPMYRCGVTPEEVVEQTLTRLQQAHARLSRQFSYGAPLRRMKMGSPTPGSSMDFGTTMPSS